MARRGLTTGWLLARMAATATGRESSDGSTAHSTPMGLNAAKRVRSFSSTKASPRSESKTRASATCMRGYTGSPSTLAAKNTATNGSRFSGRTSSAKRYFSYGGAFSKRPARGGPFCFTRGATRATGSEPCCRTLQSSISGTWAARESIPLGGMGWPGPSTRHAIGGGTLRARGRNQGIVHCPRLEVNLLAGWLAAFCEGDPGGGSLLSASLGAEAETRRQRNAPQVLSAEKDAENDDADNEYWARAFSSGI